MKYDHSPQKKKKKKKKKKSDRFLAQIYWVARISNNRVYSFQYWCKTSNTLKCGIFIRIQYCSSYISFVHTKSRMYIMFGSVCYVIKGTQMSRPLALVSPCFRQNVNVTCKIRSFLCSLNNFLLKNVFFSFFGNQISKWRSFEKRVIFDLPFTFLVTREITQKFLQHISHLHTYTYFAHPIDFFFAFPILQKLRIYHVWVLFRVTPGVESCSHHFGTINK